jgi:hypothetical protein
MQNYNTTELEVAAFLKTRGHRLLDAKPHGHLVSFSFEESAASDLDSYFCGMEVSARELFEAHRCLRGLIRQLKEQTTNRKGQNTYEQSRTVTK